MLTAKLNAAESQISQAEARAARAEAQLAQTLETVRSKHEANRVECIRRMLCTESQRERGRLLEQVATLRQSAVASVPTADKRYRRLSNPRLLRVNPPRFSRAARQHLPAPAPAKPATVPMEQSVTRAAAQAVPPPAAVKPAALRRNTLSILKPGGRI
jgi:hypothetical protein